MLGKHLIGLPGNVGAELQQLIAQQQGRDWWLIKIKTASNSER